MRAGSALRPRIPRSVLLLLLLAFLPAGVSGATLLLYPPDRTLSPESRLPVFAAPGGKGAPLSVSVNGRPAGRLQGDPFPKGEVSLAPGLNRIRVGRKEILVYCRPGSREETFLLRTGKGKSPLVFRAYRLHPALEDGCEGCHLFEGGILRAKDQKEACTACHDDFEKGKEGEKRYIHEPVAAGECTACHDPHFSPFPNLGKGGKGCMECHDPFPASGSVHRPVKDGGCTDCHDPHAGVAPKQLVREGNLLCTGCHETVHSHHRGPAVERSMTRLPRDVPRDGVRLSCLACHAPHQSVEKQLLRGSGEALCRTCHPR